MSCSEASCPDLPDERLVRMRDRAEGIPLYAVETVRMLLDQGRLVPARAMATSRPVEIDDLEVPETLHGLIAARLDGLPAPGTRAAAGRRGTGQDVPASGSGGVERAPRRPAR